MVCSGSTGKVHTPCKVVVEVPVALRAVRLHTRTRSRCDLKTSHPEPRNQSLPPRTIDADIAKNSDFELTHLPPSGRRTWRAGSSIGYVSTGDELAGGRGIG
eukprot:1271901-Rhodomonas_salina.2